MKYCIKKCIAFTLAEVLISLGIVGAIGALAIPNIAQSFQKRALLAKAKSVYKDLNMAFQDSEELMYRAQREVVPYESIPYYVLVLLAQDNKLNFKKGPSSTEEYFYSGKWMTNSSGDPYAPNLKGDASGVLQGNVDIDIYSDGYDPSDGSRSHGYVCFDVNGKAKGPNKHNVDIFYAVITKDGLVLESEFDNKGSFDDLPTFK